MKSIRIAKVTLNMGTGKSMDLLDKAVNLMKNLVGITPVKCVTNKRIAAWGLRPGLPIGCKLTLRGKKAEETLKRFLYAKDNMLMPSSFDDRGNISFGVPEYIDVKDAKYDPKLGIMGMQVSITLERPGYSIKKRKIRPSKLSKKHIISKTDAMEFMKTNFGINIQENE